MNKNSFSFIIVLALITPLESITIGSKTEILELIDDKQDINALRANLDACDLSISEQDELIVKSYDSIKHYSSCKKRPSIFNNKTFNKISKITDDKLLDILALGSFVSALFCGFKGIQIAASVPYFNMLDFKKQMICLAYAWGGALSFHLTLKSIVQLSFISRIQQAKLIFDIICEHFEVSHITIENQSITNIVRMKK